jgi:predicted GIY-YIG superfamily endonuclease
MPEQQPARRAGRDPVVTYVYRFYSHDNALLYVGVTGNLETRFRDHTGKPWWALAAHSTVQAFPNRPLALVAEATAIMDERPLHNIQRPTLERLELLKSRALGRPGAEISPYDPVAILAGAHARADELEVELGRVRSALAAAKAELALAASALKGREALPGPTDKPSQYQRVLIDQLRDQLRVAVAEERVATKRAEKAERELARSKLSRIVADGWPRMTR